VSLIPLLDPISSKSKLTIRRSHVYILDETRPMHRAVFDKKHKDLKDTSVSKLLPSHLPGADAYHCPVWPRLRQAALEVAVYERLCAHRPLEDAIRPLARRERWKEGSGLWSTFEFAASRLRPLGTQLTSRRYAVLKREELT
jgi:hypothetical protein